MNSIEEVEDALSRHTEGAVLVDFDHTLFGSNSTEEFLAAAAPSLLVSALLISVKLLLPARLFRGSGWQRVRDRLRVGLVIAFAPWNVWRWRRRAPALMAKLSQHRLSEALAGVEPARVVILSFGFRTLVAPLLSESRWADSRLTATSLNPFVSVRRLSKRRLASELLGEEEVGRALFVTDSLADADLLAAVSAPLLIDPVGAKLSADHRHYFPLRYVIGSKFETRHAIDQVVFVDLMIALLASASGAHPSLLGTTGCAALFLSLSAVYDIGYFENDRTGGKTEPDPRLRDEAQRWAGVPLELQAWIWALALGFAGSVLISSDWKTPDATFAVWLGVLAALRSIYAVYNRLAPRWRVPLYGGLQAIKSLGLFTVVPVGPAGVSLAASQAVMMWIKYVLYRFGAGGRQRADALAKERTRLALLVTCLATWFVWKGGPPIALAAWAPALVWASWRAVRRVVRRRVRMQLRAASRTAVAS